MADAEAQPRLPLNGDSVETLPFADFVAADDRRTTSFVSNFGNWSLPDDAAAALGASTAHLEWFHDTGELVLIGDVPEPGTADEVVEEPGSKGSSVTAVLGAAADTLAGPWGAPGLVYRSSDGAVRETVMGEVVAPQTQVAILAVVHSGPRMHELLWGWHLQHRREGGWSWLIERLKGARSSAPPTRGSPAGGA